MYISIYISICANQPQMAQDASATVLPDAYTICGLGLNGGHRENVNCVTAKPDRSQVHEHHPKQLRSSTGILLSCWF